MHLFLSRIKVGEQFEAALPSQDSYSCELFYFLLHCTFLCGFFFVLRLVQPHLISVIVRFVLVFELSLFMFNLVCRRLFQTGWSCSSLEVVKLTLFFHSLGCTLRIRCGDLELGFTQERAYHPYRTWLRSVMNSFRALFFVAPFV